MWISTKHGYKAPQPSIRPLTLTQNTSVASHETDGPEQLMDNTEYSGALWSCTTKWLWTYIFPLVALHVRLSRHGSLGQTVSLHLQGMECHKEGERGARLASEIISSSHPASFYYRENTWHKLTPCRLYTSSISLSFHYLSMLFSWEQRPQWLGPLRCLWPQKPNSFFILPWST